MNEHLPYIMYDQHIKQINFKQFFMNISCCTQYYNNIFILADGHISLKCNALRMFFDRPVKKIIMLKVVQFVGGSATVMYQHSVTVCRDTRPP